MGKMSRLGVAFLLVVLAGTNRGCSCGNTASTTDGGRDIGVGGGNDLSGCTPLGTTCTSASTCCMGTCRNNVCDFATCISDNMPCTSNASCCSGTCSPGG